MIMQNQKKAINLITNMLEERKCNPDIRKGDFLDLLLADMKTESFLTEKFIIHMMFGLLLASFETISATLTLAIKLISDHPEVLQQLTVSHDTEIRLIWKT